MVTQVGLAGCSEIAAAKHNLATAGEWAADAEKFAQNAMKKVEEERKYLQSVEEKWKVIDVDNEDDQQKKKKQKTNKELTSSNRDNLNNKHNHFCGDQVERKNQKVAEEKRNCWRQELSKATIKLNGTLSFSDRHNLRKHVIKGKWEIGTLTGPFHLTRTIATAETLEDLPKDGEYYGSFSSIYGYVIKERAKLTFKPSNDGIKDTFVVNGRGTNECGMFKLTGSAKRNTGKKYGISMHKKYFSI